MSKVVKGQGDSNAQIVRIMVWRRVEGFRTLVRAVSSA